MNENNMILAFPAETVLMLQVFFKHIWSIKYLTGKEQIRMI